jgi:hypothetical protein
LLADLGSGNGRNAVLAAGLGWKVRALDLEPGGLYGPAEKWDLSGGGLPFGAGEVFCWLLCYVLMYLTEERCRELGRLVAGCSAPGARLMAETYPAKGGLCGTPEECQGRLVAFREGLGAGWKADWRGKWRMEARVVGKARPGGKRF